MKTQSADTDPEFERVHKTLPKNIELAISEAREFVLNDANYWLSPFHRQNIYLALSRNGNTTIRAWLNIITVQRVMGIWRSFWPKDNTPQQILEITQELLKNPKTEAEMRRITDKYYNRREDELGMDDDEEYNSNKQKTACVFAASYATLHFVTICDAWELDLCEDLIMPNTKDEFLQMEETDTATWAAFAEAGFYWHDGYRSNLSLRFWKWWLDEALPQAWAIAN